MDYTEEGIKVAVGVIDDLILKFTPDDAIGKIDELVHLAVDKDISGADKAAWVLEQALSLVEDIWGFLLPRLIELMYQIMIGKVADFRLPADLPVAIQNAD